MGFRLIKGSFAPRLGRPDGDSVRFVPDDVALFSGLKGYSIGIKTNQGVNSVQLRYEGIDTLEKSAANPWSGDATKANLTLIGGPGVVDQADSRGYILTRRIEKRNRPISFLFAGDTEERDGRDVFLNAGRIQSSVNYMLIREGHAYPMFYNTLFADLRNVMAEAAVNARREIKGVWADDRTNSGVRFTGKSSLARMAPIFPKLWRRLQSWAGKGKKNLTGFKDWLAGTSESMEVIYRAHDGHFEDVIEVAGNLVWMTERPEDLKFRSAGS